jgi:hypothetical protein
MSNNLDVAELAKAEVSDAALANTYKEPIAGEGKMGTYTQSESSHEDQYHISETDLKTLRRVSGKIVWLAFTITFVELCERFSYYGTTIVFVNFIQQPLPAGSTTGAGFDNQSGALDMGQRASTGLTTFNQFWAYITPLFGAWIADGYLGRFNTILCAVSTRSFCTNMTFANLSPGCGRYYWAHCPHRICCPQRDSDSNHFNWRLLPWSNHLWSRNRHVQVQHFAIAR